MQVPASGAKLFSVAVVADTHLNKNDFETEAPYAVNRLANQRLRSVIEDINRQDVETVIHLGDVVHPVPSEVELHEGAFQRFFELTSELKHPLHVIPGNHDVGEKPLPWSPAGAVRQSSLDGWTRRFAKRYFNFSHGGVAFIGINAQVMGYDLELAFEQREWLRRQLEKHARDRIFLCSHYPPFLLAENEDEHYDNLSESVREEFLKLIEEFNIEGLFAGHVHHFWYNVYRGCKCYLLPSTAFNRQDFSELFRIAPQQAEFGRNDVAKLGYFLVHVYERGHEFEYVRYANGKLQSDTAASVMLTAPTSRPRLERQPLIGFDLRQDWHELVQIPPSGSLDEFDRKTVRNDYAMLALWEMGVRDLRVPASDLVDDRRRRRLEDLAQLGFRFALYSYLPSNSNILQKRSVSGVRYMRDRPPPPEGRSPKGGGGRAKIFEVA